MHVSVCIVGFRNPQDIARCLAALQVSEHRDFEIIICENGGEDAYQELAAILPQVMTGGQRVRAVLAASNLGYAGGVNTCIRETPDAEAWWVLNPDTAPASNVMAGLVEKLASGDCDAVGCTIMFPDGAIESRGGRWHPWLGRSEALDYGLVTPPDLSETELEARLAYFSGASMFIGRTFLERVGPMREEYFLYCEEIEWCLRGRRLGLILGFSSKVRVLHYQGTTTGSVMDIKRRPKTPVYLDERNKVLVTRDCFPARLPIAALAAFLVLFARYGRRGAWRQLGFGLHGWLDGLMNRRGKPAWILS